LPTRADAALSVLRVNSLAAARRAAGEPLP
jgi:hypothetical protein